MDRKQRGYDAEQLVACDYQNRGYRLLEQNWTMRGGEIDVIVLDEESSEIVFIEVKVITAMVSDALGYVTPTKLRHLRRAIDRYCLDHPVYDGYNIRIDVVFLDQNGIQDRYESISL